MPAILVAKGPLSDTAVAAVKVRHIPEMPERKTKSCRLRSLEVVTYQSSEISPVYRARPVLMGRPRAAKKKLISKLVTAPPLL